MQSSSNASKDSFFDMGSLMSLMAHMGYPVGVDLNASGQVNLAGLCYGLAYANLFSLTNNDIDLFKQRRAFLSSLYHELNADIDRFFKNTLHPSTWDVIKKHYGFPSIKTPDMLTLFQLVKKDIKLPDFFSATTQKALTEFSDQLNIKFDKLLKNTKIKDNDASIDIRAFFDTVMQFHQRIANSEMGTTGAQIAHNYFERLLPVEFEENQKEFHFSHPLLPVVDSVSLTNLLSELDAKLLKYPGIKKSKEAVTFVVSSEIIDKDSKVLGGHSILVIYNPASEGNKWSLVSTAPYDLIQPATIKETAKEILSEFCQNKQFSDNTIRGLSFLPVTLTQIMDLSLTGVIADIIQSDKFKPVFDPILLNTNPTSSQYKKMLISFLLEATSEQVEQYFSIEKNKSALSPNFMVDESNTLSVIEVVLIHRFFEKDTIEVLEQLIKCGAELNQDMFFNIGTVLPEIFSRLSTLNPEHRQAADNMLQWLAKQIPQFDINARNILSGSTTANSPTLLGDLVNSLIQKQFSSNANYLLDLIDIVLTRGAQPNLIMDLERSGKAYDQTSLLTSLTISLRKSINHNDSPLKEAILSCMKKLIAYGGKWESSELIKYKTTLDGLKDEFTAAGITPSSVSSFNASLPANTSVASTASTSNTSSSTSSSTANPPSVNKPNDDDQYLAIIKLLVENKKFLEGTRIHITAVGKFKEAASKQFTIFKPKTLTTLPEKLVEIMNDPKLTTHSQKVDEIKKETERHIDKIKRGEPTHNSHEDTITFMRSSSSLAKLQEYTDKYYPDISNTKKLSNT